MNESANAQNRQDPRVARAQGAEPEPEPGTFVFSPATRGLTKRRETPIDKAFSLCCPVTRH